MLEPAVKRAVAFIDGQNLFHHARAAYGYDYPSYDVLRLVDMIVTRYGWTLQAICFYTGVPDLADNPRWHRFWTNKLSAMGRQGISIFTRTLRYREKTFVLRDGTSETVRSGEEKGIDVRIALDIVGKAVRDEYDVALVFSQDQDLSEVADEIRVIARQQNRWIRIACAFPAGRNASTRRGIDKTEWIPIDQASYDLCLDPKDYR